ILHKIFGLLKFFKSLNHFIYKFIQKKTSNIMDYDLNDQKFFNKYQIDIMQSEAKKYYAKK
ncbi:hypothetical protein, partial [uncultured Capnocytophaga sp.]|uniref:hypothetical protein n=1 Tax=uncultured Capnocytophaga sp. TaxID=159273 RepID=UPI0025961310